MKLVKLYAKATIFIVDGILYTQKNGIFIGPLVAPVLPEAL